MKFRALVLTVALTLVAGACSDDSTPKKAASPSHSVTSSSPTPTKTKAKPKRHRHEPKRSTLSGRLHLRDRPIFAVKIDNTHAAHPQAGVRAADVVYIEQVEGGATRLAAVYSSQYPKVVGPIRSARITDIELLRQYGKVGLMFSGAQVKLLDNLRRSTLRLAGPRRGYYRASGRPAPYDLFALFRHVVRTVPAKVSKPHRVGYHFDTHRPRGGLTAHHVTVPYPFTRVEAVWNREKQRWLMLMDGERDYQTSGGRLGPTTLVVQYVRVTPSIYYDVLHNNTPESHTVGRGRALFFRNAHVYRGFWSRGGPLRPTNYWRGKGKHRHRMMFDPGQIWVALVSTQTHISVR